MRSHRQTVLLAVAISLASALFFTSTYVLNRAAATGGGHWLWTAALRYLITLPLLWPLMRWQGGSAPVWRAIRRHPGAWLSWSAIGFVLFYLGLSFAAASGPSWLVAGTFQLTVIAGMLVSPLLYRGHGDHRAHIPPLAMAAGLVVLAGVLLMQFGHAGGSMDRAAWIGLACAVVAAFAYPLGNRGLLLHLERHPADDGPGLNASQRVFGLTLASQPAWWAIALVAWNTVGPPTAAQAWLAAGVALGAGIIATILFFQATGMVRNDPTGLAATEAMQAAEILFATVIGALLLGEAWPRGGALAGVGLVVAGIAVFSWMATRAVAHDAHAVRELRSERGA
ncbi:multidrug resistance efflux transporter family protein [Lysobacter sp. A3-1-A15]|uniref:multidrug resistance efflux transporter family protein n=1 Tax=Novilysobacter viscosus TaxID=3098602 RepID=UPI002ED796EA